MRKSLALFVAVFVCLGALFAPAMGASLLSGPERSPSSSTELSGKKSQKKTCKKLKKKIKKAKSKKAKKKAKKKYNKKCKCKKLKKKMKKARTLKKRKNAKRSTPICLNDGGTDAPAAARHAHQDRAHGRGHLRQPGSGHRRDRLRLPGRWVRRDNAESTESYISVRSPTPADCRWRRRSPRRGRRRNRGVLRIGCGASAAPVAITPGMPVTVIIGAGVVSTAQPCLRGRAPARRRAERSRHSFEPSVSLRATASREGPAPRSGPFLHEPTGAGSFPSGVTRGK